MKRILPTSIALLILGILWESLSYISGGLGIPSLSSTFNSLITNGSILGFHLWVSFIRLTFGIMIAFAVGSLLGILMAKSSIWDKLLSPFVYLLTPLPKVAFLPVFMMIFGISETARIAILCFIIIFQFILASKNAMRSLPQQYKISSDSLGLQPLNSLRYVYLPYCLPHFLTALRQAFGMSIAVLFFLETFVNQKGIGYFIMNRWGMVNYPDMFAGILILSIYGFISYKLFDILEAKLCPWIE